MSNEQKTLEHHQKHQEMMKQGQGMRVRITATRSGATSEGEIRVQSWNKKERTLRGLKFGGMCWGAAIIAVIFPLIHFILVPALLVAGPILAFVLMGQEQIILGGEGPCPFCQAHLPITRAPFEFPFSDLCSECQSRVSIELIDQASQVKPV